MSQPQFFERKVIAREMNADGTEDIKLDCGHEITIINPTELKEAMHTCAECVNEHIAARKAKRQPGGCG